MGKVIRLRAILIGLIAAGAAVNVCPQQRAQKPLAGYRSVTVEEFTVEQGAATKDFPKDYQAELRKSAVARLREKQVFDEVSEAADGAATGTVDQAGRRLLLSGTVIDYDKGSGVKRHLIGYGAGAMKVKVRFVFRDAATGQEVFHTVRQGKYYGFLIRVPGDKDHPISEASGDVIDGLIKDVVKNR